ncbi:hypothetical protein [Neisseria sp. Ec49-e6-T10]|uniref:hypothetical protein n=1 Tax=Neisseria sp. Ec49-e6-T10 TaxID=3140744 RepID=UPI003EB8AEEB
MHKLVLGLLFLSSLCVAQDKQILTFPIEPQAIKVDLSCEPKQDELFGDNISYQLIGQKQLGDKLSQLILDNAQEVFAIRTCQEFDDLTKPNPAIWVMNKKPNYPLATPSLPFYNFKFQQQYWLLVKDIAFSTENQPMYHVFVWRKGQWQEQEDFFKDLAFYGFEGDNFISGFYEGAYFMKHTSILEKGHLTPLKKEVWVNDQLVKPYEPDNSVFDR